MSMSKISINKPPLYVSGIISRGLEPIFGNTDGPAYVVARYGEISQMALSYYMHTMRQLRKAVRRGIITKKECRETQKFLRGVLPLGLKY